MDEMLFQAHLEMKGPLIEQLKQKYPINDKELERCAAQLNVVKAKTSVYLQYKCLLLRCCMGRHYNQSQSSKRNKGW